MRAEGAPALVAGQAGGGNGLRERADLIEFDEHGIGDVLLDTAGDNLRIGAEYIISHQFDPISQCVVELFQPDQSSCAIPSSKSTNG